MFKQTCQSDLSSRLVNLSHRASCADFLAAEIENVDIGALSSEIVEALGIETARCVVKLGYMDMNEAGQKRGDYHEMERMDVVRVPSAFTYIPHPSYEENLFVLCLRQATVHLLISYTFVFQNHWHEIWLSREFHSTDEMGSWCWSA